MHSTDFISFRLIFLYNFRGTQLIPARGAILLIVQLAPSVEDEDEDVLNEAKLEVFCATESKRLQMTGYRHNSRRCKISPNFLGTHS